jgi:hypothetical protein
VPLAILPDTLEEEMRHVLTRPPSFPRVPVDQLLPVEEHVGWQVVCGDPGRWRVGVCSPELCRRDQISELERHDCPELFCLLQGRMVLVLGGPGGEREVELHPGQPILVEAPHNGYCPDGPHSGLAIVVERDSFDTEYRTVEGWRR